MKTIPNTIFEVTSASGFNMTSSMSPPPFSHTCRTAPETGEQFAMPIWEAFPAQV